MTIFAAQLDEGMTFTHKGQQVTVESMGYGTNWITVNTATSTFSLRTFAIVEVTA